MRLCFLLPFLPALIAAVLFAKCQGQATPPQVTPCDLSKDPARFDGQLVRVRGVISRGFEDFTIHDLSSLSSFFPPQCGRYIWLEPGGDGKGNHQYAAINAYDNKPDWQGWKEQNRIDSVRFVRDQTFLDMLDHLKASRSQLPDGTPCHNSQLCRFYRVTANITGRFFAAPSPKWVGGQQLSSGYGHMGCCHLLVIQQVTEVELERSSVPDEGEFVCTTQSWEPTAEEAASLTEPPTCSVDFGCKRLAEYFANIAAHWGDRLDTAEGFSSLSESSWLSRDLTIQYTIVERSQGKKHKRPNPGSLILRIDRKECRPASPAATQP